MHFLCIVSAAMLNLSGLAGLKPRADLKGLEP
jgi:hypothetical protein